MNQESPSVSHSLATCPMAGDAPAPPVASDGHAAGGHDGAAGTAMPSEAAHAGHGENGTGHPSGADPLDPAGDGAAVAEIVPAVDPPPPGLGTQALHGARNAALVGGVVAAVRNAGAVLRGEKSAREAARDTAVDTAAAAAVGAATGLVAGLARASFRRFGLGVLARTSAPVVVGLTAVDIGRDVLARSRRQITDVQLRDRVVGHLFVGGTTWIGIEAGAVLGTLVMPGLGTTLGAMAGGAAGSQVGVWLTREDPDEQEDRQPACPT